MSEQRKLVTVLFADVVGSTALADARDPEVVRAVMSRFFERMREIAERHGGTVEKFAGDSVMVVFGVPRVHDDDAERAVRAALAMVDGVAELNRTLPVRLELRIGVNSGEVVASTAEQREFMVSGDVVNAAERLQEHAAPGEILAGELTRTLTSGAFRFGRRRAVHAKGKPAPLRAYALGRALSPVPDHGRGLAQAPPFVGREPELRLLLDAWERAAAERTPHVFTITGGAGVGKSRLVAEAVARLPGPRPRVLRGCCLPYGTGITYWPFAEALRGDLGSAVQDPDEVAAERLARRLEELGEGGEALRARLAVLLGLEEPAAALPDVVAARVGGELAWAFRRYLELLGESGAVAVLDDLQWGEEQLLDAVEQIAARLLDGALLLVCVARPELLERRPGWGGGTLNAGTLALPPLSPEQTAGLVSGLLGAPGAPEQLTRLVVQRSEGVPLYCEEFMRMLVEEGRIVRIGGSWRAAGDLGEIDVPASIQGVLGARLDALQPGERALLQAASVAGDHVTLGALEALTGAAVTADDLDGLLRKGLLVEERGAVRGFRIRHLLIRDAAYASLPKAARAGYHEAFARLLSAAGGGGPVTSLTAHHAEAAFELSREILLDRPGLLRRARLALDWALADGEDAIGYRDGPRLAAAAGAARAALDALVAARAADRARLSALEAALPYLSGEYRRARPALAAAASEARLAGLPQLAARVQMQRLWTETVAGSGVDLERVREEALDAARRAGDERAEIQVEFAAALTHWNAGRLRALVLVLEPLVARARAAGFAAEEAQMLQWLGSAYAYLGQGVRSRRALGRAHQLGVEHGLRTLELGTRLRLAMGEWRGGRRPGRVLSLLQEMLTIATENADAGLEVSASRLLSDELIALGRPAEARPLLTRGLQLAESIGERWSRSELLANAAYCAAAEGDSAAAELLITESLELIRAIDDVSDPSARGHVQLRLAQIRAAQHRDGEAEAAFRAAVEIESAMEFHLRIVAAQVAYARFLAERGRGPQAEALLAAAEGWLRAADYHYQDAEIASIRSLAAARA